MRKDLLYLGTETGFYVSFNGGQRWTPFQLNLPLTPVTDLKVHNNDLVASTAGRAFWILDDLSPLQQWTEATPATDVRLFKPRAAYRTQAFGGGFGGGNPFGGRSAPNGAIVDFWLAKVPEGEVVIEVLDASGKVVRTFSSRKAEPDVPPPMEPPPSTLTVKAGLNRLVWNVRHDQALPVPGLYVFGSLQGRQALPGAYQVRLSAGGRTLTEPLTIRMDPRVTTPLAELQAQDDLVQRVDERLNELHRTVIRLRSARSQVEDLIKRTKGTLGGDAIDKSGKALVDKLNALEDAIVQKRVVDGQTVINFPMRAEPVLHLPAERHRRERPGHDRRAAGSPRRPVGAVADASAHRDVLVRRRTDRVQSARSRAQRAGGGGQVRNITTPSLGFRRY